MRLIKFYNEYGWKQKDNTYRDAELFEDLRNCAKKYVSKCRKRINRHIPKKGKHMLDFASGPIQYKEYLKYSKNFRYRHCVDFSKDAIKSAKRKLGKKGKYYCQDFLNLKFKKNFFDCSLSLHTLYHIEKTKQKKVVEKLIKITKKNSPIIIVYSNPNTLINKIKKIFYKKNNKKNLIYFYCHPINWWHQFSSKAEVTMLPWRSFASQHQKILFPNNFVGNFLFKLIFILEEIFSNFFTHYFQYPIIILKKK